MITVPKLEMHLAHACNLRCTGCTHYSDHGLAGIVSFAEGSEWLRAWSARIAPVRLSLLGGEPLLNRDVPAFLRLARGLWPSTRLRLVTNGLLLRRRGDVWPALAETRATLTVSIHSREPAYVERLAPSLRLARARAAALGFAYEERNSVDGWYGLYRGDGAGMEPYDSDDPRASWRVCASRHCVTLQDGALWKCPPLAHLPRVLAKHRLEESPRWRPYLRYRPLTPEATDDEIRSFFARGPESFCAMCPSAVVPLAKSVAM